ncbi:MAG: cell envelope integrity protein TolA [Rickettsiella sp.]|nr:cell envelope integrity protein TolA [Rickettsiella sp.]
MKCCPVNRKESYHFSLLFATLLHILLFAALFVTLRYSKPLFLSTSAPPPIIQATVLGGSELAMQDLGKKTKKMPTPKTEKVLIKPVLINKSPVTLPDKEKKIIKSAINTTSVVAKSQLKNSAPIQKKHSEKIIHRKPLIKDSVHSLVSAKSLDMAQKNVQKLLQQELNTLAQKQQIAARNAATTAKYRQLILQSIAQQWIIPPEVDKYLETKLMVRLAPNGIVLEVIVIKSSGNSVLDRSAQTAVYKASPLPVPKNSLFNTFQQINLTLRPESILN